MTMHQISGWFLDARTVYVVLAALGVAVLMHALWRSRGDATQDPVRESGPITGASPERR